MKFFLGALLISVILGSCVKDKLSDTKFDSPFENAGSNFLVMDSIYYPDTISQPQYIKFYFHDLWNDTTLYDHINVYRGGKLYAELPRRQKKLFIDINVYSYYTFIYYFKMADKYNNESNKSNDYIVHTD